MLIGRRLPESGPIDFVKILSITAGAAGMYCGSCLRDNSLAAELTRLGHDVTLLPVYTPTLTDEPNVSQDRVFFGGLSVYLQQLHPLFRKTPWLLDRVWDSRPVLKFFSGLGVKTDPRQLGALTLSMLQGESGHQKKELLKLISWLRQQPPPDVIVLPNSLLIGTGRAATGRASATGVLHPPGRRPVSQGTTGALPRPGPGIDTATGPMGGRIRPGEPVLRRHHAGAAGNRTGPNAPDTAGSPGPGTMETGGRRGQTPFVSAICRESLRRRVCTSCAGPTGG